LNADRIKLLKEAIKNEPKDPFNRYALAMEYLSSDLFEAKRHLEVLLDKFPDYLPTYYQTGNLYWELEELEAAKETFEKGISLALKQNNTKTHEELKSAYNNLLFEMDE
jgi:tetratricopeptide (TPR) repeat protein